MLSANYYEIVLADFNRDIKAMTLLFTFGEVVFNLGRHRCTRSRD